MGGKSFTKAASRLTTPQLEALTVYCQNRLADVFPRTERLRCVRSKDSHGDLDLLSAFDRPDIRIGPAQIGISSADVVAVTPAKSASVNAVLCRKFCDEVKEALGAKGWIIASFGYPIIALQVPCTVLEPSSEDEDVSWRADKADHRRSGKSISPSLPPTYSTPTSSVAPTTSYSPCLFSLLRLYPRLFGSDGTPSLSVTAHSTVKPSSRSR